MDAASLLDLPAGSEPVQAAGHAMPASRRRQPEQIAEGDAGRIAPLLHREGQRRVLDNPAPTVVLQLERRA
jgi:hypothetical protein